MRRLWIDGKHRDGSGGKPFVIIDPATEEPAGEAARGGTADLESAVTAAKVAFPA